MLRNLHQLFDWQYTGKIIVGDFAKFYGLLSVYIRCGRVVTDFDWKAKNRFNF